MAGEKKNPGYRISLDSLDIDPRLGEIVPYFLVKKHILVPVKLERGNLHIAMENPLDIIAIEDVEMVTQMKVVPFACHRTAIENMIKRLYGNEPTERAIQEYKKEVQTPLKLAEEKENQELYDVEGAPIVRLVNSLIDQAVEEGASDIHVEPFEKETRVRFRIDGRLHTRTAIPKYAHAAVITRIKIMGGLNIAERRLPQDGRVEQEVNGKWIDLRISVLPSIHGEKAVLRILDRSNFLLTRNQLGFTEDNLQIFDKLLKKPNGIILITGPTGSGKSTTLYAMLHELNNQHDNIITIEDPVEYMMDGLIQVQVNPKAGLTFASGLRAMLRQDPDIMMIGEIRDGETAEMAIRAAITGHLVLSTLHTNDAVSAIYRLMDMGIPSFLLSSALSGVISQRLLRKLCPYCAELYTPEPHEMASLGVDWEEGLMVRRPTGCSFCSGTGYKGRMAVHEVLFITKKHREFINRKASLDEIREYSIQNGMKTLKAECIRLMKEGLTSVEELVRTVYMQDDE